MHLHGERVFLLLFQHSLCSLGYYLLLWWRSPSSGSPGIQVEKGSGVFSLTNTQSEINLQKKKIKERGQQVPSASALHTSASKVKEEFQGSLSGSIEAQFFSGSRKVFTVMSRFTEWWNKLVPSCPDNNRSFSVSFPRQKHLSFQTKAMKTNHFREQQVMKWNVMKVVQVTKGGKWGLKQTKPLQLTFNDCKWLTLTFL